MAYVIIDIPRKETEENAEKVYRTFTDLGWKHGATGYLPQGANSHLMSKIRTLMFLWTNPERPIYPPNISRQALS